MSLVSGAMSFNDLLILIPQALRTKYTLWSNMTHQRKPWYLRTLPWNKMVLTITGSFRTFPLSLQVVMHGNSMSREGLITIFPSLHRISVQHLTYFLAHMIWEAWLPLLSSHLSWTMNSQWATIREGNRWEVWCSLADQPCESNAVTMNR